jgi:hypothetical protein
LLTQNYSLSLENIYKIQIMEKLFKQLIGLLKKAITLALYFLCLGIVVQLLIDDKILGWDPVGNIQDAGGSFIGVIALVAMYSLFIQNKK